MTNKRVECIATVSDTREEIEKITAFETDKEYQHREDATYRIVHLDQLNDLANTRCKLCCKQNEKENVSKTTIRSYNYGMASGFSVACEECKEEIQSIPPPLSSLHGVGYDGEPTRRRNNTWFEGNIRLVLATLAIGNGGADISDFCAFLDLPQASHFGSKAFNKIECVIGQHLCSVAEQGMKGALQEEIRLTMGKQGRSYYEWLKKDKIEREQIELTVSYDMGW